MKSFQSYEERLANLRRMAERLDAKAIQQTDDLLRSWDETHSRLRKYKYNCIAFLFLPFLFIYSILSSLPLIDPLLPLITLSILLCAATALFANLSLIRGQHYDYVRPYAGHH